MSLNSKESILLRLVSDPPPLPMTSLHLSASAADHVAAYLEYRKSVPLIYHQYTSKTCSTAARACAAHPLPMSMCRLPLQYRG